MKTLVTICAVVVLCLCISQASFGAITINVAASSACNNGNAASWNGYMANGLYALENGLSVNGDRSTSPTGYEQAGATIDAGEIAVTSFASWRGQLNPTGAFANEGGNRLHFGLHAIGDGTTQFMLNDLTFAIHSSDATDSLVFTGDFVGYSYNGTSRYGINWGTDRVKGGGDDVVYNSGNGMTLVDEIVYIGVGNAWWPQVTSTLLTPQAAMDDYFAWVASEAPITVTGTYSLGSYTGSDSVQVIPEPATMALLGLGGLLLRRRK